MKKEQQQQQTKKKHEKWNSHFCFFFKFPHQQFFFFFFFYFLASHTFQWLYKSHWRWCAASLQQWPMNVTIETGGDEEIYIHICINICPVLTQHRAGGCDEREAVEKFKRKKKAEASEVKLSRSCLRQTLHAQRLPLCHQLVHWRRKLLIAANSIIS